MKMSANKGKKSKSMDNMTVRGLVVQEIQQATSYIQEQVSPDRQNALNAYLGNSLGNERDGRSKFISRDCLEAVLWILPQLLDMFISSEDVVKVSPVDMEDKQTAAQAEAMLNHIFHKDNPGFMILYSWFHDALVAKNGFVKAYYEPNTRATIESYPRISLDSLVLMQTQDEVDVIDFEFLDLPEGSPEPDISSIPQDQMPGYFVSAKVIIKSDKGKFCISNIPPEELLINRDATSICDARFVGHRTRRTVSDLVKAGYSRDIIDTLPTYNLISSNEQESLIRSPDSNTVDDYGDSSTRPISVVEAFVFMDYDGDGVAELRKIVVAGDTGGISEVLSNEEFAGSRIPIFDICAIPIPHRFFGNSIPDVTADLQILRTTVIRNILDNFYLTNNPDLEIMAGSLKNPEVLATVTPGRNFLVNQRGSINPVPQSTMSSAAFPLLEAIDTWKESRTGVSRYSQGLDPNAINKTASGIAQIMDASKQRVKLYGRIFAETGVKDLFQYLLELVSKYQTTPKLVKLKEQYVTIDPREWKTQMNVTVDVGLGTGNKEQNLAQLNSIMMIQQQMMQGGGNGMTVTPDNIYNAAIKVVENSGLKTPELFFTDPAGKQPPPPAPDPKVELEKQKMQFEQQKAQMLMQQEQQRQAAEMQLSQQKQASDLQFEQQKFEAQMEIERQKVIAEIQLEREKMMAEIELKREQMQISAQLQESQQLRQASTNVESPNLQGGLPRR